MEAIHLTEIPPAIFGSRKSCRQDGEQCAFAELSERFANAAFRKRAQDVGWGRLVATYRSPKKLNIANTMTIALAPTIQMILLMISLLV